MVEPLAFVADGTEVGGADLTDDELTDLALSVSPEQAARPRCVATRACTHLSPQAFCRCGTCHP